jgi:hypothetical protein
VARLTVIDCDDDDENDEIPSCLLPVCLSPVCLSSFYRSDRLSDPIACASFPASPSLVDSLDSELWYRLEAELLLLAPAAPAGCWAVFSAAFHHVERAPRC